MRFPFELRINVVLTIVFGVLWPEKTNREEGNRKKKLKVSYFRF